MYKRCTNHVIYSSYDTFGFTILGWGVGTCEENFYAICRAKLVEKGIVEFSSIVALKGFNFCWELGLYAFMKVK